MSHRIRTLIVFAVAVVAAAPAAICGAAEQQRRLGDRALRPGVSGSDVAELQVALTSAGFAVTRDSVFDADTELAVERFQAVRWLYPSGTVGQKTVAALRAAVSRATSSQVGGFSSDADLQRSERLGDRLPIASGMSGRDVRILQGFLKRAGIGAVRVDGQFDRRTQTAVRAFERRAGRAVNGALDGGDVYALRSAIGEDVVGMASLDATKMAPGDRAVLGADGLALAPANAPRAVARIIAAANLIATKPYRYGGGHGRWEDDAYDCSGSVSFALHGADLLDAPMASGDFTSWGEPGRGTWVTIYANGSHMYAVIAGLRFDTSGRSGLGSRWQTATRTADNYVVRHPPGL